MPDGSTDPRPWRRFDEAQIRSIREIGRLKRRKQIRMTWKQLAKHLNCSAQTLKLISQGLRYRLVRP